MGMPQSPWPWNPVKKKFESIPRNNDDIDDMMKLIMMLMTVKFPWRTWFLASSCLGWETGPAMEAASVTVGGWNRKIARFLTCWILLLALGFQLPNCPIFWRRAKLSEHLIVLVVTVDWTGTWHISKPFLAAKAAWNPATLHPPRNIRYLPLVFKWLSNIDLEVSSLSPTLFSSNEAMESAKSFEMKRLRRDLNNLDGQRKVECEGSKWDCVVKRDLKKIARVRNYPDVVL